MSPDIIWYFPIFNIIWITLIDPHYITFIYTSWIMLYVYKSTAFDIIVKCQPPNSTFFFLKMKHVSLNNAIANGTRRSPSNTMPYKEGLSATKAWTQAITTDRSTNMTKTKQTKYKRPKLHNPKPQAASRKEIQKPQQWQPSRNKVFINHQFT